ncbi:phage baseplate upper protein, partial [Bacillus zhangzhouensis]
MIHKNGPIDFDVNAYTSSSVSTSINFWTQDRQTARLIFKLTKDGVPLPLAAVTGKLVLVMSDGSRFIRDINIIDRVEGQAEYILSDQEIKHYGNVQAELNLYYANDQSMSVHQFSFNISKSLIDQDIVPITEYYVDEFEALRTKINELYEETIQTIDELRSKFEDLENIETKQGAQSKADAALASAEKYTDEHAADQKIHVTEQKQKTWDAKETISGAQTKANKALTDAKAYADELSKKAQFYKLTTDSGFRQAVPTTIGGTDLFELPPGFYYGAGQYFTNLPTTNDTSWFNVDVFTTGIRKNFHVIRSADNTHWFGTIHTDGSFRGWKRILTDADAATAWKTPSLSKGWKQYVSSDGFPHTLRYTKDAFGVVEIIGSITGGVIG